MTTILKIFTDGGARGNPGPAASGVVIKAKGKTLVSFGKRIGTTTNNIAEYTAVLLATQWLLENVETIAFCTHISFFLDSQLVCFQLGGKYKIKNEALLVLATQIKKNLATIEKHVSFSYIPREQNKAADSFVNMALDNQI